MKDEIVLKKMVGYIDKVLVYCEGMSYEEFIADSKLVEACVFNLSQLGELCNVISRTFKQAHPQIPWHEMYGLRNRIVHDYEGVNIRLVWEIICEDLPDLKRTIALFLP